MLSKIRMVLLLLVALSLVTIIALASFVSATENITYTYKTSDGTTLLVTNWTDNTQTNVTLPNITWQVDLENNDSQFKIALSNINVSNFGVLNLSAERLDLSSQDFTGSLMQYTAGSKDYTAYYGYAFNSSYNESYTVYLDYSAYNTLTRPSIFKCEYNFSSGVTDTTDCIQLSVNYIPATSTVYATATNFSSFFVVQNDYVAPSAQSSGGGGGGGGGGGSTNTERIIYVTPTIDGAVIAVESGDEIIVLFEGGEYHFSVRIAGGKIVLTDLSNMFELNFVDGVEKRVGLTSFFAEDVLVTPQFVDKSYMLTFKLPQSRTPVFSLLPPAKRNKQVESQEVTGQQSRPAVVQKPSLPVKSKNKESEEQLEIPESPIDMWTIFAGIAFVILIVGGASLYRYKVHHFDNPPTVTGTGLSSSEAATSTRMTPSQPLSRGSNISTNGASGVGVIGDNISEVGLSNVQSLEKPLVIEPVEEKPYIELTPSQALGLEKFVFHSLSQGFTEEQVSEALIKKGWPRPNVEEIMKDITVGKSG